MFRPEHRRHPTRLAVALAAAAVWVLVIGSGAATAAQPTAAQPTAAQPTAAAHLPQPSALLPQAIAPQPPQPMAPDAPQSMPPLAPPADIGCPDGALGAPCRVVTDPVGAVTDAGASLAGGLAAGAAKSVFDAMTTWMVDAAKAVVGRVGAAIDHSTRPDVGGAWFQPSYRRMLAVGGVLLLPMLLLSVIQAAMHQDLAGLGRAVVVKLPLAALGMAAAIQMVTLVISVTDSLSAWMAGGVGADGAQFGKGLADAFAGGGGSGALLFIVALLVTVVAVVLWVELVLRQAAVLVVTLFLPLGFAGLVWPAAGHWLRRLAQGLLAFILAKFVITAVIALAAAGLANGGDDFSKVILGLALLALATFAPYVVFRILPVAELGAVAALEGLRARSLSAASTHATRASGLADIVGHRSAATAPLAGTAARGDTASGIAAQQSAISLAGVTSAGAVASVQRAWAAAQTARAPERDAAGGAGPATTVPQRETGGAGPAATVPEGDAAGGAGQATGGQHGAAVSGRSPGAQADGGALDAESDANTPPKQRPGEPVTR